MPCLNLSVTPTPQASLSVAPVESAALAVAATPQSELSVQPTAAATLAVGVVTQSALTVTPTQGATLTISEVCTISGGTLVVLAATDGPLRTRSGGYIPLNPATNPPT